jgi:YHS domain-containing protein
MKTTKLLATLLSTALLAGTTFAAETAVPKDYPLKTCPVSGEELGSGEMVPYKVAHEGTDVWLCCKGCLKKFNKEPAKHAQAVKDAGAKK